MTTLKMREVFKRKRARSSNSTESKPQVIIVGRLISKRYVQGCLLLDVEVDSGGRVLLYRKGKKPVYTFFCLLEGDLVSATVVMPSGESKILRLKEVQLCGLNNDELGERFEYAQAKYDELIGGE